MRVVMYLDNRSLAGTKAWDEFADKLVKLVDTGFGEIEIDFSSVTSITSLALGSIVSSSQRMATAGRRLKVTGLGPQLRQVFDSLQLARFVDIA